MNWTDAQLQTIETRDKNILVSAAAGSGKTTVLIERIKQLVLRGRVDIDRFLITTFTNAAAAEMKEKMERAIHGEILRLREERGIAGETAAEAKEELVFLQRQLDLLPQASISTFHTFAIGIMKDYFYLTDLQPGFAVGDETRLQIMLKDSVDEVFEQRFETDPEGFKAFLRKYSGDRNDERLKDQVLNIYENLRSIPRYMDWAREGVQTLHGEDPVHGLGIDRFLAGESLDAMYDAVRYYAAAAEILDREETGSIYLKARNDADNLKGIREALAEALSEAGAAEDADTAAEGEPGALLEVLENLREALEKFSPTRMSVTKAEKDAYTLVKDQVGDLRTKGKKCIDDLRKKYLKDLDQAGDILRDLAEDTGYFISLVEDTEQIYRSRKRDQNIVDFDDCMHYAIEILENETAAAEYRDRFEYIFIDEYQDSNFLQEEIIGRIARENNLFMVGDVKQSIYKFRLAEPEIFHNRYEEYRRGEDEHSIRIDLNNNFRSRRTIRDAVNRIFAEIMDGYDEDAALHGPEGETGPAGYPVSLHVLLKEGEEPDELGEDETLEELTEVEVIAELIKNTIGIPITERDGSTRPVGFGDIAVLSRGGSVIPEVERYLNNEGIPAFGETAGGYYETVEIQVFLNLLRIVSNMDQDVPLISAMSSIVFDFTPAELATIRIECREGSFYQAVRRYETEGSDEQIRGRIAQMIRTIELWREIARTLPLDELIRRLMYETGYYDYCSGLPAGEQRISNLRLLQEKAAAYEETSYLGLYGFLTYVEAMRKTNQKVAEAKLVGEGRDVVHVMTVHKSKGLEFPVVILAGAGKEIRGPGLGKSICMHKDFAVALPEIHPDQHWRRKTLLQKAIDGKMRREGLEEEIRILYVALTRPMEKLFIVGSAKSADKLPHFIGKGSFLDMIYPVLAEMAEEDPASAEIVLHEPGANAGPPAEEPAEAAAEPEEAAAAEGAAAEHQSLDPEELDRRLRFRYAHEAGQLVRSKYSVTMLNKRRDGAADSIEPQIPVLRRLRPEQEEHRLSAAEIGTAMHTCMERLDFARAFVEGLPYIRTFAASLHAKGILTDEEFEAIRPEDIDAFFREETGARAARADRLYREKEFILNKEVDGVPTVVQGVIDCYFEDAGGLVLIDYKNTRAFDEEAEEVIAERYAGQIRLYREALEEALQMPVREAWLYLFRSRKFIPIPSDPKDEV